MMESKSTQEKLDSQKIKSLFSLYRGEEDKEVVLSEVKKGITFTGSNAWILAGAIIIASVGLNVGSTAVIIGAMLISPLMGPIVGAGFALGVYDFDLFKKSLVNLAIATAISLIFSMVYFLISPIKTDNSEILSRTFPSLYDVIIAFFGGLVGVIALTHKQKGNVIPGVAIATALMPPICVAGYGIATWELKYFFGSFFLYSINCVFICLSTYIIVKFLKYPKKAFVNKKRAKQIERYISIITLLMIIPSVYFARELYLQENFKNEANRYIKDVFSDTYVDTRINYNTKIIDVVPFAKTFSKEQEEQYQNLLPYYGLEDAKVNFITDSTNLKESILAEIGSNNDALSEKDLRIQNLQKQIASNLYNNVDILKEAKVLYPGIRSLAVSNHDFHEKDTTYKVPVMVYVANQQLTADKEKQMQKWLKTKLKHDTILVYYQKM